MFYSSVTNARECRMKKPYVSWILEKVDIDERSYASHKQMKTPGNWKVKDTKN
jgi:hypothetical protein